MIQHCVFAAVQECESLGEYDDCIEVRQPVLMLDEAILTCSTSSANCSEQHYTTLSVEGKCLFSGQQPSFFFS